MEHFKLIDNIYHNTYIYQSLIIYKSSFYSVVNDIYNIFISNDYPVKLYTLDTYIHVENIYIDATAYRIFMIPIELVYDYLYVFQPLYNNISLLITIGGKSVHNNYNCIVKNLQLKPSHNYLSISI